MLRTDGNIEVKDTLGNLIEILPTEIFFYERKFRPRVITQKLFLFSFWEYVFWVSLFAFLLLSVLTLIWQLWKANKRRKFLQLN